MPEMKPPVEITDDHPNAQLLEMWREKLVKLFAGVPVRFPRNERNRLVAATLSQVLEHYTSISVLTARGAHGSAAALLRCLFEGYVRARWMSMCATEEELKLVSSDKTLKSRSAPKRNKSFREYIEEIRAADSSVGDLLANHHAQLWSALNSYTHGGALSINRRVDGNEIGGNYPVGAIDEAASIANIYVTESVDLIGELCESDDVRCIAMQLKLELIEAIEGTATSIVKANNPLQPST